MISFEKTTSEIFLRVGRILFDIATSNDFNEKEIKKIGSICGIFSIERYNARTVGLSLLRLSLYDERRIDKSVLRITPNKREIRL